MAWCDYCDPKYFIVYGFCGTCGHRCEPPLFDPYGDVDFFEHLKEREKWNEERADLIQYTLRKDEDYEG